MAASINKSWGSIYICLKFALYLFVCCCCCCCVPVFDRIWVNCFLNKLIWQELKYWSIEEWSWQETLMKLWYSLTQSERGQSTSEMDDQIMFTIIFVIILNNNHHYRSSSRKQILRRNLKSSWKWNALSQQQHLSDILNEQGGIQLFRQPLSIIEANFRHNNDNNSMKSFPQ